MHHRNLLLTAVCSLAAAFSAPAQLAPRTPSAPASQPAPPAKILKEADAAKALAQLLEIGKTLDKPGRKDVHPGGDAIVEQVPVHRDFGVARRMQHRQEA